MPRSRVGSIQHLGHNHYRVFWTEKGVRKSKTVRGTREDAEAVIAAHLLEQGRGGDMRWRDYWKAAVEPTFASLADSTVSDYRRIWRVELEPRIGDYMVGDTTWRRVESVLLDIRSASVQRHAKALWKKMCNLAVRDEILKRNPVDSSIRLKPHKKRTKVLLLKEEVGPWMEAIRGLKYEPLFLLEVGGGLRHEEACAMTKENVSELEGFALVKVERALVCVDGRKILKGTKNAFSEREVVIGEPFASRLLEICEGEGPLCAGTKPWRGEELCDGHFSSPLTITHNWRAWCDRHGVSYIRPGDMRSVFATLHGEAGTPDSLVSMAMGHADGGSTKARNYQQRTRRALMVAADSLTDYLME